ncbi:MAG: hypothetical protein A2Z20_03405 [Bdellovibrionales bacterium RBG_16_40_8]|nr:MAG: hypothetical protein A2Z20_03405 [Bdellovibrionales bacterium RBG_16_40_8]
MKRIDSRTNPLYRSWKGLLTSAGIKKERSLIISGRKLVPEYLARDDMRLKCLLVSEPKDVELLSFKKHLDVVWLKKDLFDELDEAGTHYPLLIADAPSLLDADLAKPPSGLEVVLALSNPLNLGATLRSCEAFGVSNAILLKECANPFLPKVLRSSSGSALKVKLSLGPSITELTSQDTKMMWALDMIGENLTKVSLSSNLRLFVGEEGRGIPNNLQFFKKISIPISAEMDSLNALAAVSIVLYEYRARGQKLTLGRD